MLTGKRRLSYSLPNWSGHLASFPNMPIKIIEPRRLYRQIADQLRGLVERGEYAVGTRLPP